MSGPPPRISSGLSRHISGHISGPKRVPQLPFRRLLFDDSFLQIRAPPMPSSSGDSGHRNSSSGDSSNGSSSGNSPPPGSGPGGPPIGPGGGFGNGPSGGGPHSGDSDGGDPNGGDGAGRVPLSEAAKATENVLEGCRRELQLLRRWLRGEDTGPGEGPGGAPSGGPSGEEGRLTPSEKALQVAARLEACAGALRNASAPRDR